MRFAGRRQFAFTLVELLVVIAIIGILVALLLPAIQAAREAARRTQCTNNIRNLAQASINHHDAVRFFPTGGWGWLWVGDPDRGASRHQPGGWAFNIMPYTEENSAYKAASDGQPDLVTTQQKNAIREIVVRPLPLLACPTRRPGLPLPKPDAGPSGVNSIAYNSADNPSGANIAGRTDYSINCGDVAKNEISVGPTSASGSLNAIENAFNWCLSSTGKVIGTSGCSSEGTGVSFLRSEVATHHITDGTSKTYLIGEKYMSPDLYETGTDDGDNETWCTGYNNDNFRSTINPPRHDEVGYKNVRIFGSAHSAVFIMSFCDGHAESMAYDIDEKLHRSYGNRKDGSIRGEVW